MESKLYFSLLITTCICSKKFHFFFAHKESKSQKVVSFFANKTINSVIKSSRRIIFRFGEVANVKKQLKMFQIYQNLRRQNTEEQQEPQTTGHDRFYQERSRYQLNNLKLPQSKNKFCVLKESVILRVTSFRGWFVMTVRLKKIICEKSFSKKLCYFCTW